MKYINQINLALVVIAAGAAIYSFSQTYFAPESAFVAPQSALPQENRPEADPSSELEPGPSPRLPTPPNPVQNPPRTRSRGSEGFTAPQNPAAAPVRTPQGAAAGGPRVITPRSATTGPTRARKGPIRPVNPESTEVPGDEAQDLETEPQNQPDLRRGPRRGGANPPPAQSSAPDRRRP